MPINTVYELAAMAADGDPALASAETLLLIPDLFHYWLCGRRVAERTNATTTQCFDPTAGAWATDLLERLAIPTGILPEVVPPGTLLDELAAGGRRGHRARRDTGGGGRDARHRLRRRRRPLPPVRARRSSAPARGRSSASSVASR